jgi:type I restriction enzyme S subunit
LFYTEIDESKILPEYLYFYLKTLNLSSMNVGTAVPSLTTAVLNEIPIKLPSLSEQGQITAILSALDEKIANNTKINHHLEQMAQAIFKSWFVDFEPWGEAMPDDWKSVTLGDVCSVKGGKRLPKGQNLTNVPNSHPYIRVRDMNDTLFVQMTSTIEYVSDEVQTGISRYTVSENDVIISIVGTIGLICIVHSSLNNANLTENCVKVTDFNGITPAWLYLFLSSDEGQGQIRNNTVGAVQPKLPIKNIQNISFALPPDVIMEDFDGVVYGMLKSIANNCAESANLAALRDVLLPRLISGELSVADI